MEQKQYEPFNSVYTTLFRCCVLFLISLGSTFAFNIIMSLSWAFTSTYMLSIGCLLPTYSRRTITSNAIESGTTRRANQHFAIFFAASATVMSCFAGRLSADISSASWTPAVWAGSDSDQHRYLLRSCDQALHSSPNVRGREEDRWVARVRIEQTMVETSWCPGKWSERLSGSNSSQAVLSRIVRPPILDQPIILGHLQVNTKTMLNQGTQAYFTNSLSSARSLLGFAQPVCIARNGAARTQIDSFGAWITLANREAPPSLIRSLTILSISSQPSFNDRIWHLKIVLHEPPTAGYRVYKQKGSFAQAMAYYSDSYYTTASSYDEPTISTTTTSAISSTEPMSASSNSTSLATSTTAVHRSAGNDPPSSSTGVQAASSSGNTVSPLPSSTALPSTSTTKPHSLPLGAKAAIGASIGVIVIFGLLFFVWFRSRRRKSNNVGLLRGKSILTSPTSRSPPSVAYRNTNPEPFRYAKTPIVATGTAYNAGPLAPASTSASSHNISRSVSPQPQEIPLSAQMTPATAYGSHAFGMPTAQPYGYAQGLPRTVTPPPPFHPTWHEPR